MSFKQGFRDGVEGFMFCALSGVSVAVRAWKHRELTLAGEGLMIAVHEAVVAGRFDALCGRFKARGRCRTIRGCWRSSNVFRRWRAAGCSTWAAERDGLRGA